MLKNKNEMYKMGKDQPSCHREQNEYMRGGKKCKWLKVYKKVTLLSMRVITNDYNQAFFTEVNCS